MAIKTLKTLVLKTVSVGVKLPTPADRIGLGLVADVTTHPAEVLSPGQLPLPHNPASGPYSGPRQELPAMRMREQMRAVASAAAPAGPAGCPSPGSSARRRPPSFSRPAFGWRATKAAAAAGRLVAPTGTGTPAAGDSRADLPGSSGRQTRFGCDCQSPDRHDDHRTPDASRSAGRHLMAWEVARVTTAGK
jgi:hypothetical protein